jgi:hypothetical protein
MMGRNSQDQRKLFYSFNLEEGLSGSKCGKPPCAGTFLNSGRNVSAALSCPARALAAMTRKWRPVVRTSHLVYDEELRAARWPI